MSGKQTYKTSWQGIALSVSYDPEPWKSFREVYGYALAHVTVTAPCPLSITETGFRSIYQPADDVDAEGGPVAFVLAWLDFEATSAGWTRRQEESRQLSLF